MSLANQWPVSLRGEYAAETTYNDVQPKESWIYLCLKISRPRIDPAGFIEVKTDEYENERVHFNLQWPLGHVRLISFLGLVCAALLFFSTCWSSNSGPSGPVSKEEFPFCCRYANGHYESQMVPRRPIMPS